MLDSELFCSKHKCKRTGQGGADLAFTENVPRDVRVAGLRVKGGLRLEAKGEPLNTGDGPRKT